MPTIYIDNEPYKVREGQNLLHVCLSLGFNIPYFCWHPAMHSVGACRMCAVKLFKDENDTRGKIVMSCMTLASDGTRISINDPDAVKFRKSVIEWLMTNHPHDCPVCDEGGECHLQDMTLLSGHVYRRFRYKKRTYRNQYLGPFINHEMNRCIQCYRCIRFYVDYAGGRDLDVFGWHNRVYFGRHEDGVLQSPFSGNLVEICPTGVFTDKTFKRHYTRKWDLQTAPSICVHCSLGCNIIPGERYGTLRRIRNRFNREVNGYFICDRGRFGYEFVNSPRRISRPLRRGAAGELEEVTKEAALSEIAPLLSNRGRVIGIGSPRASLESNFALRTLVGPERFFLGTSEAESRQVSTVIDILKEGPVPAASLHDVELADAVLILGEDVSNVAPMLDLSLRKSILRKPIAIAKQLHIEEWNDAAVREALQSEKGPLFIATPDATQLDSVATETYRAAPDDIARLGFAVAHALNPESPPVHDMSSHGQSLAGRIADAFKDSKRPLVISGTTCASQSIIEAAANVAYALHSLNLNPQICFAMSRCNSMGLGLIGGNPITSALQALGDGSADTLVILESNVYRHINAELADKLLEAAKHVIVVDCLNNETTGKAHYVLPAATFAEADGTLVNNEGRAQRFLQVLTPQEPVQESWRWIRDMMLASGRSEAENWQGMDDVITALAGEIPVFKAVPETAPRSDFRIVGQKVPRQPHRYSGRTAMHANIDVSEPETTKDPDSPLSFSMEGYEGQPPSSLITHFWAPHWNSVQSVNKFQTEVEGFLRGGDPGKRLIEAKRLESPTWFPQVLPPFQPRDEEKLVVPVYHIFGSDELSMQSPGIAQLSAEPYIAINSEDADNLGINDGDAVELRLSNGSCQLPAKISFDIPSGVAAVPMGLSGLQWDGLPAWRKLTNPKRTF